LFFKASMQLDDMSSVGSRSVSSGTSGSTSSVSEVSCSFRDQCVICAEFCIEARRDSGHKSRASAAGENASCHGHL
jgi:hypothetical protein